MIVYLEYVKSTECDQKVSGQYFFFSVITAFTSCSMLCPVPFKVDTFQLDTVNPAILLLLEEFAKVFCP